MFYVVSIIVASSPASSKVAYGVNYNILDERKSTGKINSSA